RTVTSVQRNRTANENEIQQYTTRSTYDIRGNLLTVTDALDRTAFRYFYDLGGRALHSESLDDGVRQTVLNVMGNEIQRRDSKGALILQTYDDLNRFLRLWARDNDSSATTLRQVIEYGDGGNPGQVAP